ncbi:hypothetical protein WAI453_005301 [Rhynchosporium graminicola]|uniref:Peptidase S54 rhomboid domain-containing protein n=2 Tax=Rhynchosporium TaxID=38037 RepID=A0A1E1MB73_RHYSE|nr:uncharacterized protein RCO7_05210 [Rhynchosporium commune]CZT46298.1 uncharacterized protein RSE6_06707 [Rhynchosporium secalis]
MPSKVVVGAIGIACVGVFGWAAHLSAQARQIGTREAFQKLLDFTHHCVMTVESLQPGHYYTLITSSFMHNDILHLGCCMMGLYSFGPFIAVGFGVPSFLILYFGSVVAGGVAQVKFWQANPSPNVVNHGVGSSGGVFGLFTAMACVAPRTSVSLFFVPMPISLAIAVSLIATVGGMQGRWLPDFGHADHMGGMAFGAAWAFLVMRRGAPLSRWFQTF